MNRIVILGGPRTGKSTLGREFAARLGVDRAWCTDDLMHLPWSEASAEAATWFDRAGPFVIEGVAAGRALRKWLAEHRNSNPCDVVLTLWHPHEPLTKGQETMAKGCRTVWLGIVGELVARGVSTTSDPAVLFSEARAS